MPTISKSIIEEESLQNFKAVFFKGFWKTITSKSLFPIHKLNKDLLLSRLYESISNETYEPSAPRQFIVSNKGNAVARLVPIFKPEDICLYFYCVKQLESEIAINRVPNTYGGWRLGGKIREQEKIEMLDLQSHFRSYEMPDGSVMVMDETTEYATPSSFNPDAWRVEWGDFTGKLYAHSRTETHSVIVEMDIANFYDSIRLDLLKKKINKAAPAKNDKVELLFKFLKGINTIGIPQDESADCSRILANFYLQEYDQSMEALCNAYGAKYFRYADDQVIFCNNRDTLEEIICRASLLLTRFGLSINQKKLKFMNRVEFEKYYAFDLFITLSRQPNTETIKDAIKYYSENKHLLKHSGVSVLLRLLGLLPPGLDKNSEHFIFDEILDPAFLNSSKLRSWHLSKIYRSLPNAEQSSFLERMDKMAGQFVHNFFHLTLRQFLESENISTSNLERRINHLNDSYQQ